MAKVVITGANGFLGTYLCNHYAQKGLQVNALVHHMPTETIKGVTYILYDLADEVNPACFEGADYFIHCAYIKVGVRHDALEVNIEGSERLLKMSHQCGLKKNIFISSVASRRDALSLYGMQKFACEKLFNPPTDLILRPGLILGNGGLFGQMRTYLQKSQYVPLISGGKQAMQTIHIDDLALAIDKCIEKDLTGILTVASTETTTTKDFYRILCESLGKKPFFVYLPFTLLFMGLSVTETIGINLPVSRENLLGLKRMSYIDTTESLTKLGITVKNFEESIKVIK
jgi:nucleoside-diphosphate-sugar epimerase